jgi:Na+/H+ antiporter NhaD/arsenite permease-like protein
MLSTIIAIVVFIVVIAAIVSDKIHRTTAAIAGMVILLLTGVLNVDKAIHYIDFNTLGVLVGMMIFVGVIKNSGLFEYISIKSAKIAKGDPWKIMVAFILITAVCSALLDNVTTVLLVGPMTITIANMLDIDPVPTLLAQIFASNIGGTATLIGDPPNIMIGTKAGFGFPDFIKTTGMVCVFILIVLIFLLKIMTKKKLIASPDAIEKVMKLDEHKAIRDRALLRKSLVMIALVVLGFMLHDKLNIETSAIALTAAAVMLLIGKQNLEEVIAEVEWPTILFFMGLFVLVGGLEEVGVIGKIADLVLDVSGGREILTMLVVLWASAFLSSILDNIPFVATMIPLILDLGTQGINVVPLWWALSLGACLGGNGTLIGASANVVLSSIAEKHGYPISFMQYTKRGFPVMLMSLVISTGFLLLRFGM